MAENINYRHLAREALARARDELAADDPSRVRYAALELRDAIEALTYDRALAYKDEIPPEEYKTWQPRKLMNILLEIAPKIGVTSSISFGEEEEFGKPPPPEKMKFIGTDHVLGLADIKKHYDALGNYLHVPSLEQLQKQKLPDNRKQRKRCDEIVLIIDKILSSVIWNSTIGNFSTLPECANDACKKPIRKRLPHGIDRLKARCYNCDAEYSVEIKTDGKVSWKPDVHNVPCANSDCLETISLWKKEIQVGTNWRCKKCGTFSIISLCSTKLEK